MTVHETERAWSRGARSRLSPTSIGATAVVLFLIGAGASTMAWWRALAFEGQTMRGSDSPEVFVLLTFSVMFFVAADLTGTTLLWHLKRSERAIMRTRAAVAGLIIVYSAASTTTLALI